MFLSNIMQQLFFFLHKHTNIFYRHGTVPQETILDLRGDLEKIGKAKGLTKEEKGI